MLPISDIIGTNTDKITIATIPPIDIIITGSNEAIALRNTRFH